MKTLAIHPKDISTTFLADIYKGKDWTIRNDEWFDDEELIELIKSHDRIIMMGHGNSMGLFDMDGGYIVDTFFAKYLMNKECIGIWCHANQFFEYHGLNGWSTSMFISEVDEAVIFNIRTTQKAVDESNHIFSALVNENIDEIDNIDAIADKYKSDCEVITYNRHGLRSYQI